MDPKDNNQGSEPVNPSMDEETDESTVGTSVPPVNTTGGGTSAPMADMPTAKCAKCDGEMENGNCKNCAMTEGECTCPPATPGEAPTGNPTT